MTFPSSTSHYMQLYVFLWLMTERDPDLERADSEKVFMDPGTMEKHPFPSITSEPSIGITLVVPAYNEQKRCKHLALCSKVVSQARPTSGKIGKGLVNCVYKPCPTALYSVAQSRCSILSHDTLHHYLSSNSSLENDEHEVGHLFCYCRNCKNTSTILLRERAYSATGNSRVHYLKIWLRHPANCIPVGHGLYTQFTRPFPFLRKWVWLV